MCIEKFKQIICSSLFMTDELKEFHYFDNASNTGCTY